jgi:hypothetical protein
MKVFIEETHTTSEDDINDDIIKDYYETNQKIATKNAVQKDQINIFEQIKTSLLVFNVKEKII